MHIQMMLKNSAIISLWQLNISKTLRSAFPNYLFHFFIYLVFAFIIKELKSVSAKDWWWIIHTHAVFHNSIKARYDELTELIDGKKVQRELFKGFIKALEKQDTLIEEFDEGLWSSLVQEVVIMSKDDIRFIFKNGNEIKTA